VAAAAGARIAAVAKPRLYIIYIFDGIMHTRYCELLVLDNRESS